jgi:glycerol-3-phosphate dehydrogenase (NAD+)
MKSLAMDFVLLLSLGFLLSGGSAWILPRSSHLGAVLTWTGRRIPHRHPTTSLRMNNSNPPPYPVRIAVMGGGNFGLALATIASRQGIPTTILVRQQEVADSINNENRHPHYMKDIKLPSSLRATADPAECLPDATYIVHAVPVQYSRAFLNSVKQYIPPNTPVLSGSKGIETTSLGFMVDILKECLGNDRPYAFLSGPSFAREMCEGVATAVVVASRDLDLARDLAQLLSDDNFRVFTSKDIIGLEIGGAVKNVIALAAGMCEGLGLGTNAMSGLVTRGCGEMRRLGLTLGARPSTISGLSGEFSFFMCLDPQKSCF